jgi:hypothetical protein
MWTEATGHPSWNIGHPMATHHRSTSTSMKTKIFHILEGEMLFRVADRDVHAGTGDTLLAPKGTPHTYRVDSAGGACWLTIIRGGDFEGFVRSCGRPAERSGVPDPSGPPTPERVAALAAECMRHGIGLVGPPLH